MTCCVVETDDGFVYTMPVLPGAQPIVFSYRVPFQGSSFELDQFLVYPVAEVNLLMPESEVVVTSDNLSDAGLVPGGDGTEHRRLTGRNLSVGAGVSVRFESTPVANSPAPAPQPVVALSPFFSYGLLTGGAVLLLTSAILLWHRRSRDNEASESTPDLDDEAPQGDLWFN